MQGLAEMRKEGMCVIAHSKCHLQLRLQISQPAPCRSPAEGCQGAADSLASSCIKVQQLQNMHNKISTHILTFVLLSETAPAQEILGLCFILTVLPLFLITLIASRKIVCEIWWQVSGVQRVSELFT